MDESAVSLSGQSGLFIRAWRGFESRTANPGKPGTRALSSSSRRPLAAIDVGLRLAVKVLACDARYAGSNPVGQPISSPSSNRRTVGFGPANVGSDPAGGIAGVTAPVALHRFPPVRVSWNLAPGGQVSPLAVCAARLCFSAGRGAQAASFRAVDPGPNGRWSPFGISGGNRIRVQIPLPSTFGEVV